MNAGWFDVTTTPPGADNRANRAAETPATSRSP